MNCVQRLVPKGVRPLLRGPMFDLGITPKKLGRAYFEEHIAKLEREADELEAQATRIDAGEG